MDRISKYNVVHKLEKRSLLIAINCVCGLSIFFFGYDQGMMGGVNNARDYYEKTMKFGHVGPDEAPVIDDELLQGGIVSLKAANLIRTSLISFLGLRLLRWYSHGLSSGWLVR